MTRRTGRSVSASVQPRLPATPDLHDSALRVRPCERVIGGAGGPEK